MHTLWPHIVLCRPRASGLGMCDARVWHSCSTVSSAVYCGWWALGSRWPWVLRLGVSDLWARAWGPVFTLYSKRGAHAVVSACVGHGRVDSTAYNIEKIEKITIIIIFIILVVIIVYIRTLLCLSLGTRAPYTPTVGSQQISP